jgi:hypothetical protein
MQKVRKYQRGKEQVKQHPILFHNMPHIILTANHNNNPTFSN